MNFFFEYLRSPHILFSVTIPLFFVIMWYFWEGRHSPPKAKYVWIWMACVIASYFMSFWEITEETISLHIVDAFIIYLCFHLASDRVMTPGAAFSLSFTGLLTVDMVRAIELVDMGHASMKTWYFGIGGAGMFDGLCVFPLMAAGIVHYVAWRKGNYPLSLYSKS